MLIPPRKIACAACGRETDYLFEVGEETICAQCCCLLAGSCGDCEGPCRGLAWPDGGPPALQ
jgi:hypothetical protein